jgi:hypothetical protein
MLVKDRKPDYVGSLETTNCCRCLRAVGEEVYKTGHVKDSSGKTICCVWCSEYCMRVGIANAEVGYCGPWVKEMGVRLHNTGV